MSGDQIAYSREGAAKACSVSLDTIAKALAKGELRAKRTSRDARGNPSGKYVIPASALQAWIDGLADA